MKKLSYRWFLVPCTVVFSLTSNFYFLYRLRSSPIKSVVNVCSSNCTPPVARNIAVPFDCRLQITIYNINVPIVRIKIFTRHEKYSLLLFRLTLFLMHLVISDGKLKYTIFNDYDLMRNNY